MITRAPPPDSARAVAAPRPDAPPVTMKVECVESHASSDPRILVRRVRGREPGARGGSTCGIRASPSMQAAA